MATITLILEWMKSPRVQILKKPSFFSKKITNSKYLYKIEFELCHFTDNLLICHTQISHIFSCIRKHFFSLSPFRSKIKKFLLNFYLCGNFSLKIWGKPPDKSFYKNWTISFITIKPWFFISKKRKITDKNIFLYYNYIFSMYVFLCNSGIVKTQWNPNWWRWK